MSDLIEFDPVAAIELEELRSLARDYRAEIAELKIALSATAEAAAVHLKNKMASDAEIARLREVLRKISNIRRRKNTWAEDVAERMKNLARKALEQKP